jgi:hypothetical protein
MRLSIAVYLLVSGLSGALARQLGAISDSEWTVSVEKDNQLKVDGPESEITSLCSGLTVKKDDGTVKQVDSCNNRDYPGDPVIEEREGGVIVVTHVGENGFPTLEQRFENAEEGGFIVSLGVKGGGAWSSNKIAPISSATLLVKGGEGGVKVRPSEERSDNKSYLLHIRITNHLLLVASLIAG